MNRLVKRVNAVLMALIMGISGVLFTAGLFFNTQVVTASAAEDTIVLRVCNWEEYIDEGGWDKEDTIDLESGDIIGENSMVSDFEDWYYQTYGKKVKVQYSCLGDNEAYGGRMA